MAGIRIGTRASTLARWQTSLVQSTLIQQDNSLGIEVVDISADGDVDKVTPFASMGTTGIFTRRIEQALLDREVRLAVHSLKDLPSQLPPGVVLGAFLPRADPRDVLISDGASLDELKSSPVLATGSPRRRAQVILQRPDAQFIDIRGNVGTRIKKFSNSKADGLLLAAAGLLRLGLEQHISHYFEIDEMIPAAGQGIIAVECLESDREVRQLLSGINHPPTMAAALAERQVLSRLGAGCQAPVGVHAEVAGAAMTLRAVVLSADAAQLVRHSVSGELMEAEKVAAELADQLLNRGAEEILTSVRSGGAS